MQIEWYIILSIALFCIGVAGALTRRNAIIVFMCIELMLNSVNLLLVAFSKMHLGDAVPNAHVGNQCTNICFLYYDCCRSGSKCGACDNCNDVPKYKIY